MEQFNPSQPEYKKVEDLPVEEQENFTNTGDGFVAKEAAEKLDELTDISKERNSQRTLKDKILGRNKVDPIDVMHEEANNDNIIFHRSKLTNTPGFDAVDISDDIRKVPGWEKGVFKKPEEVEVLKKLKSEVGSKDDPDGNTYQVSIMKVVGLSEAEIAKRLLLTKDQVIEKKKLFSDEIAKYMTSIN